MRFEEVVGNERLIKNLNQSIIKDKLPHAILLLGSMGYGGSLIAQSLISRLLCENPSSNDSCGNCAACRMTDSLAHPDVHFSFPVMKKEGLKRNKTISDHFIHEWREHITENPFSSDRQWFDKISQSKSNGNINTEECRAILDRLANKAYSKKYKIQIIWYADYLGINANRLLKIIEEPPPRTIFILLAEDIFKILPTLISRLQVFRLLPIHKKDMYAYLKKYEKVDSSLNKIINISEGDLQRALTLLNNDDKDLQLLLKKWLTVILTAKADEIMKISNELSDLNNESKISVFEYFCFYLRQDFKNKWSNDNSSDIQELQNDFDFGNLNIGQLEYILQLLNESAVRIMRNVNNKLLFYHLSLELHKVILENTTVLNEKVLA